MTEFQDDEDFFGKSATASPNADKPVTDDVGLGDMLDLTEDDLSDGSRPEIPVNTWLRLGFYDVEPSIVTSDKNYGKPKYTATFVCLDDEYGKRRKFPFITMCLFKGAFFSAYPILRSVNKAPTQDMLKKGAFFDEAYMDEFQGSGLDSITTQGGIFTPSKKIPKGAYVFPSPKQLIGLELYGKVTHYGVSGDSKTRYKSEKAAEDDGHMRAFPVLGEYRSIERHEEAVSKLRESSSLFKGDE